MKQVGLATYTLPLQGKTLTEQMVQYLEAFDHAETAGHNLAVAQEAKGLAERFQVNADKAYSAGLLHDVSVVIPHDQRIALQIAVGEPILDAERQAPFLLHQQQSALLAKTVFQVSDPDILSAISCHTTLKAHYRRLDLVLQANEFDFELVDEDGTVLQTKANDATGKIYFDALAYDKAGEYHYTIREKTGTDGTITYDTKE